MKTPLFGDNGKPIGIQAIFWDVTARIRAEEQLKEQNVVLQELAHSEHQAHEGLKNAQSRLVQTEKLASLGQLVAGVAHEINNPLSFVSNNVAVLERDLRDLLRLISLYQQGDTSLREVRPDLVEKIGELDNRIDLNYSLENLPRLIERTREGLRRIERIVKELRLFARVDEGDWTDVDLNPGIESSINIIKGYARKRGVRIVMDLGALPLIRCRAARIHQVIVNLLTNAIDACADDEGVVTVHTQTEPEEMGVRIVIEDNGTGIDPAIRERIFDPFFTTKPLGQGTGLGLSISYGIIQEHGGRIEVQSSMGCGSCFTVHLPIEPQQALIDSDLPPLKILDDGGDEGEAQKISSHPNASTAPDTADALSVTPAIQTGELEP
jgi:signal transduction histidine kinase